MPRKSMRLGALALLVTGLLPAIAAASAAPLLGLATASQPRDENRYVNLADPSTFRAIQPDVVTQGNGGRRIEIYSSVGANELGMDWRTVNEFAYLVNSVPKGFESYTTLFNSLYDGRSISYVPQAPEGTGKWTVSSPTEAFSPTAAYLNQTNLYDTEAERLQYIHVLGAKESIDEAYAADSSLARLVRAGTYGLSGQQAVDYHQCRGAGGCLSGSLNLMHSKYGAFEKTLDSTGTPHNNVVWITSSNLNGQSGSKKSNVSIVIYDDKQAYDAIKAGIFEPSVKVATGELTPVQAMNTPAYKAALAIDPATQVITGMPTDSGVTLFPSPRATSGAADKLATTDVEAAFLRQRASDNAVKTGCRVYAVHSLFNSTRAGVREGLGKLFDQKCDVRIVLGVNAISDIVDGYFNMSTSLRELVGRVEFADVHDKTLSYQDSTTATTFGGASNFTGPGLEYDELAFRADNQVVTQAVQAHSERIYQLARGQVTWATPTGVSISPTGALTLRAGESLQLSPRVAPDNALITNTAWTSSNPAVAVSPQGVVTSLVPGAVATITVTVSAPGVEGQQTITKSAQANVTVVGSGTTTPSAGDRAYLPPTLTMDNYQGPNGSTDFIVTWGSGGDEYDGIVKLQYYSSGWTTYPTQVTVKNGVGRIAASLGSSKTWRAYGARLDRINGQDVPNSTAQTMSKWSITTVRTQSATTTPRLYATSLAKSGEKVPFLISWNVGGGVFRLQMKSSSTGSWSTHSTYQIPSGGDQEFISIPILNTKYWRIATSTGTTQVSNTVKVVMQ